MSIKTTLEQIGAAAQKLKNEATAGGSQMYYIGDVIGDLVEVTEQIHSQMENGSVSDDELAAIQGANSPNATNSFATMNDLSDISGLSIQSAVVVETTSNAKTNGAALIAAYTAAKALTPNGEELSATNRASVIIPPGVYDLGSGALTLDTQYVDIIGLTTDAEKQFIYSVPTIQDTGTLVQTANDVRIANIKAKCEISQELLLSIFLPEGEPVFENVVHVPAAYFPSTNLSGTVCDNSIFEGGDISEVGLPMGFSMRVLIEYSGTFNYCTGGGNAFGGAGGTASGTFTNCTGGDVAFGGGDRGTASGTFTNCTGGNNAFGGAGTASGTFTNCTGGAGAFGSAMGTASGTFTNCTGGKNAFGGAAGTASGTFTNCTGGKSAFGGNGGMLSGQLYYCRLTTGSFQTLAEGGKLRACVDGSDTFIDTRDYVAP